MLFGLRNAAQTFQRFIDKVLRGLHFCYAYIDDLLIASTSSEEHQHHLRQVFQRLSDFGVIINPTKCHFGAATLQFLGHYVNRDGIRPLEEKVQVIRGFPLPKSHGKLRKFLGLVKFYRRFLPHAADLLYPLTQLSAHLTAEPRRLSGPRWHKRRSELRRIHWQVPHSRLSPPHMPVST